MKTKIPSNIQIFKEIFNSKYEIENLEIKWPYSDLDYYDFSKKVLDLFCSESLKLDEKLRESILCDLFFVSSLINYSNNQAVIKNDLFISNNADLKNSKLILKNLNLEPANDKKIFNKLIKNLFYSKKNLKKKIKIFGSRNETIEQYAIYKNNNFSYDYYQSYFFNLKKINNIFNDNISNFVVSFFHKYEELSLEHFNLKIDYEIFKKLWIKRIKVIENFKINFKQTFNFQDKEVFFSNNENQYNRILASALNYNMIHTYSFDHGYDNYIKKKPSNYWFRNLYQFHVTLNESSKKFLSKDIKLNSPFTKELIPNFLSFKSQNYKSMKKKFSFKKNKKNIKTVMLIGFPMTSQRYYTEIGSFWYYKLILEIKVLKSLKKANYKVIYKIHPEQTGWESIISKFCDEIRYSNFEDRIDDIDLFIFTYTSTSTFCPALCSDIPIILIDTDMDQFNESQIEAFKKRCKILNIKFDKKGYYFNENNLHDSIKSADMKINEEYFENFLI